MLFFLFGQNMNLPLPSSEMDFYLLVLLSSPFNPREWLAPYFSFQYHSWIKHYGYENKGNDNQLKNLLIVKQILLDSTLGNV